MRTDIVGTGQVVDRLAKFNKAAYKVMTTEIKGAMKLAADDIRVGMPSDNPLRNWGKWSDSETKRSARTVGAVSIGAFGGRDLGYNPTAVASSVKFGAKKSRIRGVGTTGIRGWAGVGNAGGSIFTTAGAGPSNSLFVNNLRNKYGSGRYPRVMSEVWVKRATQIGQQIDAALDRARASIGL